jgi:hypothetical protein
MSPLIHGIALHLVENQCRFGRIVTHRRAIILPDILHEVADLVEVGIESGIEGLLGGLDALVKESVSSNETALGLSFLSGVLGLDAGQDFSLDIVPNGFSNSHIYFLSGFLIGVSFT